MDVSWGCGGEEGWTRGLEIVEIGCECKLGMWG